MKIFIVIITIFIVILFVNIAIAQNEKPDSSTTNEIKFFSNFLYQSDIPKWLYFCPMDFSFGIKAEKVLSSRNYLGQIIGTVSGLNLAISIPNVEKIGVGFSLIEEIGVFPKRKFGGWLPIYFYYALSGKKAIDRYIISKDLYVKRTFISPFTYFYFGGSLWSSNSKYLRIGYARYIYFQESFKNNIVPYKAGFQVEVFFTGNQLNKKGGIGIIITANLGIGATIPR